LAARGLCKRYGSIEAVQDVDLTINRAEIVALVGDNGAGKSSVIKMLSGAIKADAGVIEVEGRPARIETPADARRLGIETVHQDLALLPNLDVVTNLFLGREIGAPGLLGRLGFVSRRRMQGDVRRHLDDLRITIPRVSVDVEALSGGQRQSVAVARAIVWARKLLIMDEPTAALGVAQSRAVLELVTRARDRGMAVIIISHILPHVLNVADRVVVLRHGKKVADLPAADVDEHGLIELIVGVKTSRYWLSAAEGANE
jgi:ABC-type sugar transport system ATPase subunit